MSLKPRRIVFNSGFMLNEMLWHEFETYLPSNCIVHHAAVTEGRTIHDVVQHLITLLPEKFSLIGFRWEDILPDNWQQNSLNV